MVEMKSTSINYVVIVMFWWIDSRKLSHKVVDSATVPLGELEGDLVQ